MSSNNQQPQLDPLVIGISSRALFDLAESHQVYEEQGLDAYRDYQISREDKPLERGVAFPLVQKLLSLNDLLQSSQQPAPGQAVELRSPPVEVILLSRNSADTGLRVFHSIQHHGLKITRAAFCSGDNPYRYIGSFDCHLFLSTNGADVRRALELGVAAATILPSNKATGQRRQLRIAFDGDAVLFSDEAQKIYQREGEQAFTDNERKAAAEPLGGGPFKPFLARLQQIQQALAHEEEAPIRTCLVTARSMPACERVVRTLRAWNIRIDESLFLEGRRSKGKGEFLRNFDADIFFDDQEVYCESARSHVATGHVPYGVANEPDGTSAPEAATSGGNAPSPKAVGKARRRSGKPGN